MGNYICVAARRAPSSSKASNRFTGICCSSTTVYSLPLSEAQVTEGAPATVPSQPTTEGTPFPSLSQRSRTRSRASSRAESTHRSRRSSKDPKPPNRKKSEPQPPQPSTPSSSHNTRTKVKSEPARRRSNRSDSRPKRPEHSNSGARAQAVTYPTSRSLTSTVKQVLADHSEFRILVLGRRGSGKSSLINAAFRVDMSTAPTRVSDINVAFRPDDNRHLIVYECSGLEPGNAQGLGAIRDFISNRTDPSRAARERLHAIWICVPTSDALDGNIGEGVEEILSMRRVPVIVAFTKSDMVFPQLSGSESGNSQYQDHAMSTVYTQCEQLSRPLFRREPRDVPAELVSVMPQFGALVNNLIVTTDRFIMGSPTPSARSSSQETKPRIAPGPLAWSVALRASRDISIQASIEIGRSRHWRNLWSTLDFFDQPLKSCVDIIHVDIVEIWNLYDKTGYLSSDQFYINMSHVVKDLAVPAGAASPSSDWNGPGDKLADWVCDVYRGSQENVRCMMGYIINLTVILDSISKTAAGNATENVALKVTDSHIRSGCRDSIHRDIRKFVEVAVKIPVPQKDLVLEKIIDLIGHYCSSQFRA